MNKKRDRLEIIHSILKSIQEKGPLLKPTHILYKSNLSHQMLTEYLGELIKGKFVKEETDKEGKKCYSLEEKGFNYLKDYDKIRSFLESYGLD